MEVLAIANEGLACFRPKIIDGLLREPPRDATQDPIKDREHVRVLAIRGA
jgi:hypothetical protein